MLNPSELSAVQMSAIAIGRTQSFLAGRAAETAEYMRQRGRDNQSEFGLTWARLGAGVKMVACMAAHMDKARALHEFSTFTQEERRKIAGALGDLVADLSTVRKIMAVPS